MLGQKLSDRYEIVSELGRGGMGVVYKAHDPRLNRDVAIKLIPPALLTPQMKQRFETEAKVVAQMDHPAIVPIHDFGDHEGSLFFVMPVVEGTSLRAHMREQSLSLGDVLTIGIQVAEALEYSHSRGVIHRDIKPENIMVTFGAGSEPRIRVMDFGLARTSDVTRMTRTGTLVGTVAYLSPEQVSGEGVDQRADLYALGTVLYELVCNEVPFTGEMQSVLYRIVHEIPPTPRERGAEIEEALDRIIADCIQKDPAQRPAGAGQVVQALKKYRAGLRDSEQLKSVMATRTMMVAAPKRSPFIGRKDELKELQQRFNLALAGKCQMVAVAGEAGVGKTRLLEELENLARARQVRVLHGRFLEQEAAFPYFGFCEAIQEYFQQKETDGSASSGLPDLSDLGADLISLFPMLSEIEPIRSAATGSSRFTQPAGARTPESQGEVFELLARTLTRLAGGKPLVLLFEDLHGADVSVEALQYVVRRLGPTPTLVVTSYRSNEVDRRHPVTRLMQAFRGDRHFSAITLGPLEAGAHREFLSTLVGGSAVADEFAAKLYEISEGHPFFTKELVRSLMESGQIQQDASGSYALSGAAQISADSLPATIQEAVEERVGRLPEDLRDVLSTAAVMGKTFEFKELEDLADAQIDLDDAVDQLISQGLVEEDRQSRGDRLTFTSGVVREVLYAELSRRRRRSLHRKYARLLERRHDGRLEGVYPQLVHHFAEGDEPEKTVEYGLAYARRSLESFSPDEVVRATRAALEYLDREWEGERAVEGDARLLLAAGRQMGGDIQGALKDIDAAIRIFEQEKQEHRVVEALLTGARAAWHARRTEDASRWVERGMQAARGAGEIEALREMLSLAATLANLRGEYKRANTYLEEAAALAPARAEAPGEEIPRGGTLVVPMANPVPAAGPVDNQFVEEMEVHANIFETLLATDQEGTVTPLLGERWEARDGGRAFRLTLREGVRFHDGHVLTAADVVDSFQRAVRETTLDLPAALAALEGVEDFAAGRAEAIAGLEACGDLELDLRLSDALPIYMAMLTDSRTAICRRGPDGRLHGTGPYSLAERGQGTIRLRRHDAWWRGEPPRLEGIEFRTGLTAAAIAAGFRSGEFDLARDLLPDDLDAILRDSLLQARLVEVPRKFTYFVLFNAGSGPVAAGAPARRALAGVLNPHEMVWQTVGRFAQPAAGFLPPGILGHDPGRRRAALGVEEARRLLDEAGVPATFTLRAAVQPLLQDRYGALMEALFQVWSELGATVAITTPDMASFLAATENAGDVDLYLGRFGPDYDDPDNFTSSLFDSKIGFLRHWYQSPETDRRLEEARGTSRPEEREALYRRFEDELLADGIVAPLFFDVDYRLTGPRVRGLTLGSIAPYVNYTQLGKGESSSPVAADRPRASGVLHVPMSSSLATLDPATVQSVEEEEIRSCVYETLTKAVGEAQIVPWLAESLKVTDSGAAFHVRLHPHIRFHDGRRLTARDVRYSFERFLGGTRESQMVLSPIRGAQDILEGRTRALAGFRIRSGTEFTIELDKPLAFFPALLAFGPTAILPEGSEEIGRDWQHGAVGTGPFRVKAFQAGRRVELERNPSYWRRDEPASEGLVFHLGVAPAEILAGFRAGRFSLAGDLRPEDVEALRREPDLAAGYREAPHLSTYFAALNSRSGPLADRDLRRRVLAAVVPADIVQQTLGRLALPSHGLIPPGLLGYEPTPPAGYLTAAGATGPAVELTAAVHPVYAAEYSAFLERLLDSLRESGVRVRITARSMEDYLEAEEGGGVDLFVARWAADFADADTFAYCLHSEEGFLRRYAGSPQLDRFIEQGRTEADPRRRHAIYRRIEESVAEEALLMPLFHEQVYRFARPEVQNLSVSYQIPTVAYEKLKLVSRPGSG